MKLGKRLRDEYERVYRPSSDYEAFCQDSGISPQKKDKKPGYFNPFRVGRYVLTAVSCLLVAVIVIPIGAFLIASIRIKDSVRSNEARFSLQEVELAQSKTFRALNEIEYRADRRPADPGGRRRRGAARRTGRAAAGHVSDRTVRPLCAGRARARPHADAGPARRAAAALFTWAM